MKAFSWETPDADELWPYLDLEEARRLDDAEPAGLPMTLGPADSSGTVPPSPFDISEFGGAYPPTSVALVRSLNWEAK